MRLPRIGDEISVKRQGGAYEHYGIYVGKGRVVHYHKKGGIFWGTLEGNETMVQSTSFEKFLDGSKEYRIHIYDNSGKKRKIITVQV